MRPVLRIAPRPTMPTPHAPLHALLRRLVDEGPACDRLDGGGARYILRHLVDEVLHDHIDGGLFGTSCAAWPSVGRRMASVPGSNPHCLLSRVGPFGPHSPVWECDYCKEIGSMEEMQQATCTFDYPPCEHCGETPECAKDCSGMAAVLGDPNIYLAGFGPEE